MTFVELSGLPSCVADVAEPSWHDAPPRKLPDLERGLDIATYWLLKWGVSITWHHTKAGDYAMIGSVRTDAAAVVARYFEERERRAGRP